MAVARADLEKADSQLQEAKSALQQAVDELETKQELQRRNPGNVALRDIERLQNVERRPPRRHGCGTAAKQSVEERIYTLLPAEKASAEAALAQAQVDLDKTVVRAGVSGRVEQFVLRVGDIVNPLMRPAGVLIPDGAGQRGLAAGFGQIEAQIMKVGMIAEITCVSKPFTVIPMVVTDVQDFIAAGQFRGGEQLIDAQQVTRAGHAARVPRAALQRRARRRDARQQLHRQRLFQQSRRDRRPGDRHPARAWRSTPWMRSALVHALILRLQALVLPFQTLVFSGH